MSQYCRGIDGRSMFIVAVFVCGMKKCAKV